MLHHVTSSLRPFRPTLACGLAALLCSACAQTGSEITPLSLAAPAAGPAASGLATADGPAPPARPITAAALPDIEVSPPVASAIRQARTLRQSGKKAEALELLDKTGGADKDLALIGERGLLALELGQVAKAERLLARAQNPERPDWRLQSAYGAALSANGRQVEAQEQFAKALAQAPDQPSILNNLALSFALDGKHDAAEKILRQAANRTGDPQAKQNLALILGLKGQVKEARALAESTLPPEKAEANVAFFERLGSGHTRTSPADPAAAPTLVKAASVSEDKPILQLGIPE